MMLNCPSVESDYFSTIQNAATPALATVGEFGSVSVFKPAQKNHMNVAPSQSWQAIKAKATLKSQSS